MEASKNPELMEMLRDSGDGFQTSTLDAVLGVDKVMYEQHDHLYVIESLDQCKAELADYLGPSFWQRVTPLPTLRTSHGRAQQTGPA